MLLSGFGSASGSATDPRRYRLGVRTQGSQPWNRGSNPRTGTILRSRLSTEPRELRMASSSFAKCLAKDDPPKLVSVSSRAKVDRRSPWRAIVRQAPNEGWPTVARHRQFPSEGGRHGNSSWYVTRKTATEVVIPVSSVSQGCSMLSRSLASSLLGQYECLSSMFTSSRTEISLPSTTQV
jgi:hypothetical protein